MGKLLALVGMVLAMIVILAVSCASIESLRLEQQQSKQSEAWASVRAEETQAQARIDELKEHNQAELDRITTEHLNQVDLMWQRQQIFTQNLVLLAEAHASGNEKLYREILKELQPRPLVTIGDVIIGTILALAVVGSTIVYRRWREYQVKF